MRQTAQRYANDVSQPRDDQLDRQASAVRLDAVPANQKHGCQRVNGAVEEAERPRDVEDDVVRGTEPPTCSTRTRRHRYDDQANTHHEETPEVEFKGVYTGVEVPEK